MCKEFMRSIVVAACLLPAGCKTFVDQKTLDINWEGSAAEGTITVSQPKMYQRASLINERNMKEKWLKKLVQESESAKFTPQIVREFEQIKTFAAALGLNFDPATAVSSRRANETGEIQQQIDVLKLQLQLDQLKRDAELVRTAFATQTTPANENVAKLATAAGGAAVPAATAVAADQLRAAIGNINTDLAKQMSVDGKVPATYSPTDANPADLFRDRAAYRGMIEAALNATGLDDAHDMGGHALTRLNFQATVLPDRRESNVPGVIQMKVEPPEVDQKYLEKLYRGWLDHLNLTLNRKVGKGWKADTDILNSAAAENFDVAEYMYAPAEIEKTKSHGKSGEKKGTPAVPPPHCAGLIFNARPEDQRCEKLTFAVPRFAGSSAQEGAFSTLESYQFWFELDKTEAQDSERDVQDRKLIIRLARELVRNCGLPVDTDNVDVSNLYVAIKRAQILAAAGDVFGNIDRTARLILRKGGVRPPDLNEETQKIRSRATRARRLLANFVEAAYKGCSAKQVQNFYDTSPMAYLETGFNRALQDGNSVSMYEIGPREQVQQVSSIVRVANNLTLAAALAAAKPGTGMGVNAAVNYSRQAMGKAATVERLPELIGYAAPNNTFGWVIGPRGVLDAQGGVDLEQTARTFDLSVDLSLPGWWPYFTIQLRTAWAPKRADIINGTIGKASPKYITMRVPNVANYADYDVLTSRLKLNGTSGNRQVSIDESVLEGQSVSACRGTTLYVSGSNIWRANSVLIGGTLLGDAAIAVAPDMSGILLAVPALDEIAENADMKMLPVSVFTRYGPAYGTVQYMSKRTRGCKAGEKNDQ
jgi:hypothetical protein